MTSQRSISGRRTRQSGGNSMLEWMFVLLPTMGLITFFFDVCFAIFSWTTLQNAVREGARYAITFQLASGVGQDDSVKQVVAQYSMGLVSASSGLINVNYFTQAQPDTPIPPPGGNVPGNIVEVSIQTYPLQWMIPISGTIINPFRNQSPAAVSVYSSDVLGGYPSGIFSVQR